MNKFWTTFIAFLFLASGLHADCIKKFHSSSDDSPFRLTKEYKQKLAKVPKQFPELMSKIWLTGSWAETKRKRALKERAFDLTLEATREMQEALADRQTNRELWSKYKLDDYEKLSKKPDYLIWAKLWVSEFFYQKGEPIDWYQIDLPKSIHARPKDLDLYLNKASWQNMNTERKELLKNALRSILGEHLKVDIYQFGLREWESKDIWPSRVSPDDGPPPFSIKLDELAP